MATKIRTLQIRIMAPDPETFGDDDLKAFDERNQKALNDLMFVRSTIEYHINNLLPDGFYCEVVTE